MLADINTYIQPIPDQTVGVFLSLSAEAFRTPRAIAERSSLTVPVRTLPNMKFIDYLALQTKVSKGDFAFWMRRWGAEPRSMGYLLDTIHSRLERRPDTLESILWDAEVHKLSGPALVGFVVSELKARVPA